MKKYIILAISIDILLIGFSIFCFFHFYCDKTMQSLVDLFKIVIQATLTGMVTFSGLFFTIWSQEHQNKQKQKQSITPHIIVKKHDKLSAKLKIESINDKTIICTTNKDIRTIECTFCNCKNNYVLNLYIKSNKEKILLSSMKDNDFILRLAISSSDDNILFYYEDISGQEYCQKLAYRYSNSSPNGLQFISYQPERVKKNVSKNK